MKKYFVLIIVLALLAVTALPVLAGGGAPNGNKQSGYRYAGEGAAGTGNTYKGTSGQNGSGVFALAGKITGLDAGTGTVTVAVASGNTLVKPTLGQDVALQTTGTTRFLMRNPGSVATPITFSDLAVGQKVSAVGQLVDNVWTATRITVGASLVHQP